MRKVFLIIMVILFSTIARAATLDDQVVLNAYRIALDGEHSVTKLVDGVVDAFNDQKGININSSTNAVYGRSAPLILHADGADGATTTTNAGTNQSGIMFRGSAQIDTVYKKFGYGSFMFNGTTDYVALPDSPDWDVAVNSNEDWTIDFWVKHNDHAGEEVYMYQYQDGNNFWTIEHKDGSGLRFWIHSYVGGVTTQINTGYGTGSEITDTDWHHIALVKVGSDYAIYKDGTQVNHVNSSSTFPGFKGELTIGAINYQTSSYAFNGYIDEVRIHRGNYFSAAPNSSKTDKIEKPISQAEVHGMDTPLWLNFEGTDGATTTVNSGSNGGAITFNGNAQIDTAQYKLGSSSLYFDGSGDSVTLPDSDDWNLFTNSADSWTIDCWVRHVGYTGEQTYVAQWQNGNNLWWLYHYEGRGPTFEWYTNASGTLKSLVLEGRGAITDSNWHHVALVRLGNKYGIYKDGIQIGYTENSDVTPNLTSSLQIGKLEYVYYMNGHIDEIRVQNNNYFNANPSSDMSDVIDTSDATGNVANTRFYRPKTGSNMTITSQAFTTDAAPSSVKVALFEQDIDSITLPDDLKVAVNCGGGWVDIGTLSESSKLDNGMRVLSQVKSSGLSCSGTNIQYQITTYNNKKLKINGVGLSWD